MEGETKATYGKIRRENGGKRNKIDMGKEIEIW